MKWYLSGGTFNNILWHIIFYNNHTVVAWHFYLCLRFQSRGEVREAST